MSFYHHYVTGLLMGAGIDASSTPVSPGVSYFRPRESSTTFSRTTPGSEKTYRKPDQTQSTYRRT